MPDQVKIAQQRPTGGSLTELYVCPAGTIFAGKLSLINETTSDINVRVSIADNGAADAASQYIIGGNVTGFPLFGDGTPAEITGITLGPTDKIRVYAATTGVVFTLNGIERTV